MRRLRVLLSAYACSPVRGSEPGLGWNVATRLARYHDVTVLFGDLTGDRATYHEIFDWLADHGPIPGLDFRYVGPTLASRAYGRICVLPGLQPLYYPGYRSWQRSALREALRMHRERRFDIAHQLNMIGYREPGYLYRLDIPFVWGPIGGAPDEPWPFIWSFGPGAALQLGLRRIANSIQKHASRRPRAAARRAARIWTVTSADYELVTTTWGRRAIPLVETGTAPVAGRPPRVRLPDEPLRLVWSGLHIPRKCLPIVLHALARLRARSDVELTILGSGPETVRWQRLSRKLGLSRQVRWLGWRPRVEAMEILAGSHALVFPSVKEASSMTVFEALGLGTPIVCHDACGMGTAVTASCGIKVPLRDPETSIVGFSEAIRRLLEEPELLQTLSRGALARAADLTWDRKAELFANAYQEILAEASLRPSKRPIDSAPGKASTGTGSGV